MVQANDLNLKYPKIKNQFLAEVEFGMPSKECRNFGICRITPIRGVVSPERKRSQAIITLLNNNHLEMDFLKAFLSKKNYEKFLAKKKFLVEEDYHYSANEDQHLNFRILKGEYFIKERSSLISIVFQLDENYQ